MSAFPSLDRVLGLYAARALIVLAAVYVITGSAWVYQAPDPASLTPTEPYLTILEILLFLSLPAEVVLFAAVHSYSPPRTKMCSLVALIFIGLLAGISGGVHWVMLTVGRQTGYTGIPGQHAFYPWPTVLLSLDLFAWDVCQGLGLLFAAPAFRGDRLHNAIRVSMFISGALCLVGVAGATSGDLRFQYPAIFGYVGGLTVVCVLLARLFARLPDARID
jgi:hypothetical protein